MPFIAYDSPEFRKHLQESPHARGEVTFLQSICKPGMTALDVGANKGVTTLTLAKAVGGDGRVWAFEPVPASFALLQTNLSRNEASNVEAFQMAVGEQPGVADFYEHGEGSGIVPAEQADQLKVTVTTIDGFLHEHGAPRIGVISLDCEGSELLAFRGAEKTLIADAPQVFCEIHHGYLETLGQSVTDVVAYLTELGYQVRPLSVEHLGSDVGLNECSHIHAAKAD